MGKTKKRQSIRKAIIIGMFLLFPITITWLSPALPVIYAAFGGILTGAVIIFLLQFLTSLFLGRAFCGYLCSAGGLQECMMLVSEKRIENTKVNAVKWLIWVPWVLVTIALFIRAGGVNEVDFFAGTVDNWIFLIAPYRYMIYFGVILLIVTSHLIVGKRATCHCVCWMAPFMIIGTKVSDRLKLPRLRLKSDRESCTGCNLCTKKCPMSLDVKAMVKAANMKNPECILCGECIDICPKKSIAYTFKNKSS
ncbi:MAG: 4Fe-4S binding protein [Oscillospiraceae bacterium]|nr:4Fe-4S binding protein [Oscillospiraceae bacterium]